jgi:hypothetical protein
MTDPLRARLEALPRHLLWRLVDRFQRYEPGTDADDAYVRWADVAAALREPPEAAPPWQPIDTAPKDRTIIGALIRDGRVWRVHEMKHNGLAFYTTAGGSLPKMTHWIPMPAAANHRFAGEVSDAPEVE